MEIVTIYAGARGNLIAAAVSAGARGIVVQAFGWGNVNEAFYGAIREAIRGRVPVVITSRVPHGRGEPVYGYPGGGAGR